MKAEVKILVEYNPADDTVSLSSRGVEGDGLPLEIYIKVLFALSRLQKEHNEFHEKPTVYLPTEVVIGQPSTPPTPKTVVTTNKMRKAYTEEEKNEIAQLYQDGLQVNEIARRFGRKPESIYKLVSSMGVKRNQESKAEKKEKPATKKESVLKKPWYLQSQKPNNSKKTVHE